MKDTTLKLFNVYELKLRLDIRDIQKLATESNLSVEETVLVAGKYLERRDLEHSLKPAGDTSFQVWGKPSLKYWMKNNADKAPEPPIDMEIIAGRLILQNLQVEGAESVDDSQQHNRFAKFLASHDIDYSWVKSAEKSEWEGSKSFYQLVIDTIKLIRQIGDYQHPPSFDLGDINKSLLRHDLDRLKSLCDIDGKSLPEVLVVMSAYVQHRFQTRGSSYRLAAWTNVRVLDWYNNLENLRGFTSVGYDIAALKIWIDILFTSNEDLPVEEHYNQVVKFFKSKYINIELLRSSDISNWTTPEAYAAALMRAVAIYYEMFKPGQPKMGPEERALRRSRMNAIAAEEFDKAVKEISVLKEAIKELGSLVVDLPDRTLRLEKVSSLMARLGIKS